MTENGSHSFTEGSEPIKLTELDDVNLIVKRIWRRAYMETEEQHVQLIQGYVNEQLKQRDETIKGLIGSLKELINMVEPEPTEYPLIRSIDKARKLIE